MPDTDFELLISRFFGLASIQADGANLTRVEKIAAAIDSANYLNTEMAGCNRYQNSLDLLTAALSLCSVPNGLMLEFGVATARTINHLAKQTKTTIYGFDGFEGLPEDWRVDVKKGAFKRDDLPVVESNVNLVVGWFDQTLPTFVRNNPEPVSFLHVDCDIYSSTKTIFEQLEDRIISGTVIVFDEYFNYIGWRRHEWKAFQELVAKKKLAYRYFGAVPSHQQVGVIITG